MALKSDEVAEVTLRLGRFHLVVRGVYVAMEGDPCRDPLYVEKRWTHANLIDACEQIEKRRWRDALDRWNEEQA